MMNSASYVMTEAIRNVEAGSRTAVYSSVARYCFFPGVGNQIRWITIFSFHLSAGNFKLNELQFSGCPIFYNSLFETQKILLHRLTRTRCITIVLLISCSLYFSFAIANDERSIIK